jgi:adenosylmethionine-8-amino-7-oxononanoate aminotransferase
MHDLLQKDKAHIWHPFTPLLGTDDPILISSAEGIYLHTADGRRIIDGISSWWVNLHGHSNPVIAAAIAAQASTLEHVIFAGFTHEPAIRLSQNLLSILPANQQRIFFSDNGSTAVEVALKMAMQFRAHRGHPQKKIVALDGAYHGDTFGSMSVGERGLFTKPFDPYLFDADFIPFPDEEHKKESLEKFEALLKQQQIGIFIYEPLVQGASGMRMYTPDVLEKFIILAKEHNVTCIADEVFTGFGRTGKYFASEYVSVKPDIMAVSKGITGGTMPLGVTSCSAAIAEAFLSEDITRTFFHGHSYTANPLACAAANASFELLTNAGCQRQIQNISKLHVEFSREIQSHPRVGKVRTLGTILAIELKTNEETSYTNSIRKKISAYFLSKDILLRPLGNIIYVLPPYVIQESELRRVYQAIVAFLDEH